MGSRCDSCGHWYSAGNNSCPKCKNTGSSWFIGIWDDRQLKRDDKVAWKRVATK